MDSKKTIGGLLAELGRLHPKRIDLSLARIERLLEELGNPHHSLPPVIHIAGTNGKGSVAAMLAAILNSADKKTHRYHSPHLIDFNERILLNDAAISDETLIYYLEKAAKVNAGAPISFFEITTAAAFCAFADKAALADYLILETGLGGRLDATNLAAPALTAITSIGADHQEFLGDSIGSIAAEKAGIIKRGVAVISAPQIDAARAVIVADAATKSAPLYLGGQDWQAYLEHGRLVYQDEGGLLDLPPPALAGAHQILNSGVAVALARQLGVEAAHIGEGLASAKWAGRLQKIVYSKYPALQIWLDGAHNPPAAAALADWLEGISAKRINIIVALGAKKKPQDYFAAFTRPDIMDKIKIRTIAFADNNETSAADPAALAACANSLGLTATATPDLETAIYESNKDGSDLVLICGSLYLVADALKLVKGQNNPQILLD